MSIRSRAPSPSPPGLATLSLSAPRRPSARPTAPTAARYQDVRRWPKTSSRAGLPQNLFGIAIKAPSRTDVITSPYDPQVRAVEVLLLKAYDRVKRHGPRVSSQYTQGARYNGLWKNPPGPQDAGPVIFDEKVGAINFRATLTFKDGTRSASNAFQWRDDHIKLKVTAVMDGSNQTAPWEVMLLTPTPVTIDYLFPPVPAPDPSMM